jgi:hypothetical protein
MRIGYVVAASALCLIAVGAVTAVLTTGAGAGAGAGSADPGVGTGSVRTSESASATTDSAAGIGSGVARFFAETPAWRLSYRLDCGSGGDAAAVKFQVRAFTATPLLTLVGQAVGSGTAAGTGQPGWQVLSVSVTPSTCDWSLAASQTPVTTTPSQP